MRTPIARLGLTLLFFLIGGLFTASPARAADCPDAGVTVVVEHEGTTTTECAEGDPKTAGEALESAGFEVEKVQSDPRMLCTIDRLPKTSCAKAPEAKTYWAFFTASGDGAWEFADKGVFDLDPEPGSAIGLRFGDGAEPSVSPADAAADAAATEEDTTGDADDGAPASEDSEEGGSAGLTTTIVGVVLLVVLAGGAFVVARRRN